MLGGRLPSRSRRACAGRRLVHGRIFPWLSGGFRWSFCAAAPGTRLAEQTEVRPKPLVEIGGRPILWHIMKHYSRYGFNEFVLALGYKGDQIKRYFLDYHAVGQDMTISLQDGQGGAAEQQHRAVDGPSRRHRGGDVDGRPAAAAAPLIGGGTFMLTYGDGVGERAARRSCWRFIVRAARS